MIGLKFEVCYVSLKVCLCFTLPIYKFDLHVSCLIILRATCSENPSYLNHKLSVGTLNRLLISVELKSMTKFKVINSLVTAYK